VVVRFERTVARTKLALVGSVIALTALMTWLYWPQLKPRRDEPRYQLGPPTMVHLEPHRGPASGFPDHDCFS